MGTALDRSRIWASFSSKEAVPRQSPGASAPSGSGCCRPPGRSRPRREAQLPGLLSHAQSARPGRLLTPRSFRAASCPASCPAPGPSRPGAGGRRAPRRPFGSARQLRVGRPHVGGEIDPGGPGCSSSAVTWSASLTDRVRQGGCLGFSYRTPVWKGRVRRSGGATRCWLRAARAWRRRSFRADRGRDRPSSTRAAVISQGRGCRRCGRAGPPPSPG